MAAILPWGHLQHRLHRRLLQDPELLPRGGRLLLAVSGGQDSMALVGLLLELRRLHQWDLWLWHGDHGWRAEASAQAEGLAAWARAQGLPMLVEQAHPAPASEAAGRTWRYARLRHQAETLGAGHVVTGHTGSDRAETLLLNLARGCGPRGLSSLRRRRRLADGVKLVRPLLDLCRADTAAYCRDRQLPLWPDPSNTDPRYGRNRIRQEVMPVLEALHPGAWQRLSGLGERLESSQDLSVELMPLALETLRATPTSAPAGAAAAGPALQRQALSALPGPTQEALLDHWLERNAGIRLGARSLETLRRRLPPGRGPGSLALPGGRSLIWDRVTLRLLPPQSQQAGSPDVPGSGSATSPPSR